MRTLARAEAQGIEDAGGTCDIFQIPEVLPQEVLEKMHAAPKDQSIAILDDPGKLEKYDAFLFGIPTRYGNFPAQWKSFWDKTGSIWQQGGFWGKYAGLFVATGTMGGGQESTAIAAMSTFTHHGIIYVPLGYKTTFQIFADLSEVRGGSPWGAGTFSVSTTVIATSGATRLRSFCRQSTALVSRRQRSSPSRPHKAERFTRSYQE